MPGAWIETFGCQMNVDDSERLMAALAGLGYSPAREMAEADLVVINTCSVRAKAEHKACSLLGALAGHKSRRPGARIALTGCLAQQEGQALLDRFPHLDLVCGTGGVLRLPERLAALAPGARHCDVDLARELPPAAAPVPARLPARTQLTIMQGCDNFCAYCVVPRLRGRERSRPAGEILAEAARRLAAGAREINLLGQNVNSYRHGEHDFPRLLAEVAALPGLWRLKFTTSHPKDLTPALMEQFAALPNLCPSLHLPFQAGSDRVLAMMNRRYTRDHYLELVSGLRRVRPDLALHADCIVGFPGETEDDFEATMDLLERVRFDGLYSFRYSDRPGTAAMKMPDKVPLETAARRLSRLQTRQQEITLERNRAWEGREVEVLVEGPAKRGALMSGRTPHNKVVNFPGPPELTGRLARVRVVKAWTNSLRGRLEQG